MVKPELGTKRTCPSCGARFYDLLKSPIECPKCGHSFDAEVLLKSRRTRPDVQKLKAVVAEEEEAEEAEETEEEVEEEAEEEAAIIEAEPLDEEAEDDTGAAPPGRVSEPAHKQDGLTEVEEEDEIDTGDVEDDLIEPIEDEEDDVAGVLDAEIEGEEER